MLSAIVAILAAIAGIGAIAATLWQFWEPILNWLNWAQGFVYELFDFLPTWLVPFAGVAIILALVGLGVKLL